MTSNDTKKKVRSLQRANPGMKYTEALRHIEAGVKPGSVLLGTSPDGKTPMFLDPENATPMGVASSGKREVVVGEFRDMNPSAVSEEAQELVTEVARKGRAIASGKLAGAPVGVPFGASAGDGPFYFAEHNMSADDSNPSREKTLVKLGNILIVAPPGSGAMLTTRGLAEAAEAAGAAELAVVVASNTGNPGDWPEKTVIHGDSENPRNALGGLSKGESKERRFIAIERPEEFADPETWWKALIPLLENPAVVVSVHVRSVAAVPAGLTNSFHVRAVMGAGVHSDDDVNGTVGTIPEEVKRWPRFGSPGTGIIQEGNGKPTGFCFALDLERYARRSALEILHRTPRDSRGSSEHRTG